MRGHGQQGHSERLEKAVPVGPEKTAAGRPRVGPRRRGGRFTGPPVADNLAVAELDDPIGVAGNLAVMGNENNGMAIIMQFFEDLHDLLAAGPVEGSGRFVGEDDVAAVHQGPGDGNPLLLPAGQLAGPMVEPVGHPQPPQQQRGMGPPTALVDTGIDRRDLDIFKGGEGGEQMVALEDEAEVLPAQIGQVVRLQFPGFLAGYPIAAAARPVETADDIHQGRFAGTGRADDGDHFSGGDGQVNILQDAQQSAAGEILPADAAQFKQGPGHHRILGIKPPLRILGTVESVGLSPITTRSPSCRPSRTTAWTLLLMPIRTCLFSSFFLSFSTLTG